MKKNNQIIINYIKNNLSPKQSERNMIKSRYEALSKILDGVNFQTGSYARFTAITPVNDLDVIWELPSNLVREKFPEIGSVTKTINSNDIDVSDILNGLAEKLRAEYAETNEKARVVPQKHSVGIFFGPTDDDFSIDVVPAIPLNQFNEYGDSIYYVPEITRMTKLKRREHYLSGGTTNWIKSDPRGYIKDAQEVNDKNNSFRKATKFIKGWKKACKEKEKNFKLKSFHIEQMVREKTLSNEPSDSLTCIQLVFEEMLSYFKNPKFPDRANNSKYIDSYLNDISIQERAQTEEEIKRGADIVAEIDQIEEKNMDELLLKLFYKTESGKAEPQIARTRERVINAVSRPYCYK